MAKEHKRLTPEELRGFKGCENYTNEEAMETIISLEKLSVLMYGLHQTHELTKSGHLVKRKSAKGSSDKGSDLFEGTLKT